MRIKSKLFMLMFFLLLLIPNVSVIAHECVPACTGCKSCEAGVCVNNDDLCGDCESCVNGSCESDCTTGQCCSHGNCINDCPSGECCDDGDCVEECPTCKECEDGECEWECTNDFDCGGECGICNANHCCVPDESICDGWECAECDTTSMTCVPNQGECPPLGDCVACSLELSCKGSHDFCGSGCQTCDEDTKECTDEWTPIDPFELAPCDPYPCMICQSDECEENDNITSPTGWSSFSAPGIPDTCPNVDEDTCDASGASMIDDCKNTISLKCSTPDGTGGDEGCAYRIFYNQTNFSTCVWITGDNSLYYRKATVTGDGTTAEVFYKARHVSFDFDKDESCTGCCCSWISVYFCLNKDLENPSNNPPSPNPITAWRKASDCPENLTEGVACPGH
jgi:hypothetical protein